MTDKAEQKTKNTTTLKGVYFYYTRVNLPMLTKAAKDKGIKVDPENPMANCEYVVKVAVTEKVFKAMKKKWKGCTNFKNAKEYTIAEFKQAFHKDSEKDMPDFGEAEDVVIVKFSQKSQVNGKDAIKPQLIGIKGKVKDNNNLPITQETLLGNGTKGHLQVRFVDFGENGTYLYPNALCITDLVEYAGGVTEVDYDDFGIEELDEEDEEEGEESLGEDDEDGDVNW